MKMCNTYLVVAAMAVAGLGMSTARAADNTTNLNNTGAQMQQTGSEMADASTSKEIRGALAKVVNDGLEKNKFNSFLDYLDKTDRDRVGSASKSNLDSLNTAIDQFRQDFKSKYNQDFDISADHLQNAMIYAGQDKKSATVSFANPAESSNQSMNNMNSTNNTAVDNTAMNNTNNTASASTGAPADRTLNTPPNETTVSNRTGEMSASDTTSMTAGNRTGPASNGANSSSTVHGNDTTATPGVTTINNTNGMATNTNMNNTAMASMTLNLINEGHIMNEWRINAPQLSLEQIKANLTRHIQMLDDQKAAWPSDVNQAYQAAAYHVLHAFTDTTVASDR